MMQDGAPRWKSVNAGGTASINGLPAGAEQVQTEATSAMGAAATVQSRKVPGAAASTVDVDVLWNSMTRWLLKSPSTSLRFFVHSSFSRQDNIAQSSCTSRPVWPIPLPYWGKSYSTEKREVFNRPST